MGRQVKDLLGHKSGFLTVIQFDGLYEYAGQNTAHWVCHCSLCDGKCILPRKRLTSPRSDVRYDRCCSCRVGKCIVCGTEIGGGNGGQLTCSHTCLRIHDNHRSKLYHSARAALDKTYYSKKRARHQELKAARAAK